MKCNICEQTILYLLADGICPKCGLSEQVKKVKPPKLGRPVTKTAEEREAKHKQWFKDNKESRREYQRKYQQKRRERLAKPKKTYGERVCPCGDTFTAVHYAQVYCCQAHNKMFSNKKRKQQMREKA